MTGATTAAELIIGAAMLDRQLAGQLDADLVERLPDPGLRRVGRALRSGAWTTDEVLDVLRGDGHLPRLGGWGKFLARLLSGASREARPDGALHERPLSDVFHRSRLRLLPAQPAPMRRQASTRRARRYRDRRPVGAAR